MSGWQLSPDRQPPEAGWDGPARRARWPWVVLAVAAVSVATATAVGTGAPERGRPDGSTIEIDDSRRPGQAAAIGDADDAGADALTGAQQPSGHWARPHRPPAAWEALPEPPVAAPIARLVAAGDQAVLVAGPPVALPSHGEDRPPHAAVLDDTGNWQELADPPLARLHSAAWFDGRLVVMGRDATNQRTMATLARTADGWADTWHPATAPPGDHAIIGLAGPDTASDIATATHTATNADAGALIALASDTVPGDAAATGSGRTASHYRYRPESDRWQALSAPVWPEREVAVGGVDGRLAVIGRPSTAGARRALTVYEPRTRAWSEPVELPFQQWQPGFVADGGGGLYAYGPNPASPGEPNPASARWHPRTGWQELDWRPPPHPPDRRAPQLHRDDDRLLMVPSGSPTNPATLDLTGAGRWQSLPAPSFDYRPRTSAWTGESLVTVSAGATPQAARLTLGS